MDVSEGKFHTAPPEPPPVEPFTRRERDILLLMEQRLSNPEIARELSLALSTVKWYVQQILSKLGVNSRRQAVVRARALGLFETGGQSILSPVPSGPAHNLPRQLTRFIGRERDMAQVKSLLTEHALVTLTGAGGVGKTRLAFHAGESLLPSFPDGVWLVELASLADSALLAQTCARALGVIEISGLPMRQQLIGYLERKRLLLILDNCEHLLAGCAELVQALLNTCRSLSILATSREALNLPGEMVYRLPSLVVAEVSFAEGLTAERVSDETIRATLERLGVRWKRAKQWITSPDPEYQRKKSSATG